MNKTLFGITVLLVALAGKSQANSWSFDYTGNGVSASGTILADEAMTTFEGKSGYYITGITGQRNGVAITALLPTTVDAASGFSTSADGRWWFDNVMLSSGGFDLYGLLFATEDGGEYNLYKDHGQYIDGYFNKSTGSYNLISVSDPITASVPDGGVSVTMLGGLLVGIALIRRQLKN